MNNKSLPHRRLKLITLVVDDYDRAIDFFVGGLGFSLVEDTPVDAAKRWVIVRPGASGADLLLARGVSARQRDAIGAQTGGRVAFFLYTDNIVRDMDGFAKAGAIFEGEMRAEAYGKVTVFRDIFGNRWDLIEPV